LAQDTGGFRLTGVANGLSDNNMLFLQYERDDKSVTDSALVVNGKFMFQGQINEKAVRAILGTRDYDQYKLFWLENSAISFSIKGGNLRKAIIQGSVTQTLYEELDDSVIGFQKKEAYASFITRNPNSIISAFLLSVYGSTWGKASTQFLYNKLADEVKNTSYGKSVFRFISLNKEIKVGDYFADFAQPDQQQNMVKLSDLKGKVILLEFWGSWCGPCRKAHPKLVEIYNDFKNKGFEIFGVGAEVNREQWINAIEKDGLTWTNVTDFKGDKNEAALIYGVSQYPTNFLIDRNGVIIAKDIKGDSLRNKLKELLD